MDFSRVMKKTDDRRNLWEMEEYFSALGIIRKGLVELFMNEIQEYKNIKFIPEKPKAIEFKESETDEQKNITEYLEKTFPCIDEPTLIKTYFLKNNNNIIDRVLEGEELIIYVDLNHTYDGEFDLYFM